MNEQAIMKIADRVINGHDTEWNMNIESFDWVPGVGLYGIYQAYKKTGEKRYFDFLTEWISRHLQDAYKQITVNSVAPLLTVSYMYEETKNPEYIRVCTDLAEYVLNDAPRTADGGLEHTVTEAGAGFSDQVWADTLFMVCIFMANMGRLTGERKYGDFAAEQLCIHHRLLTDGNGLYFHGYNGAKKDHMSAVRWGRANAWIIYSTMKILNMTGDFEGREEICKYVQAHVKRLSELQQENGGFCTVIDNNTSYVEISATAGIIAGVKLAAESGIVDKKYISVYEKGCSAVLNAIDTDGSVLYVSTGTPVMENEEAYKNILCTPTLYGQGLAITAL